jgi:CRISPR type IV-associated protein Csf1
VLSSPIKNSLHIIWKASLTLDPDHWLVQFGNRTLTVRRKLVLRIAEITKELSDAMILASTSEATAPASPHKKGKKPKKKAAKRRPMLNPYQSLDYTLSDGRTGVLRTDVEQFLQQTGRLDDLRTLQSARLGELWALPAVLFRGDKAEKPKPTFPK